MKANLFPAVSDDLTVTIADRAVKLSARQGIKLSEQLARVSFRQIFAEEAAKLGRTPVNTRGPARRGRRTP